MIACPTDDVLKQVLTEQLTAEVFETVALHVGACTHCREKLARLTEDEGDRLGVNSRFAHRNLGAIRPGVALAADGAPRITAIDGFEFLECLGRGGMGVVYKARDRKLKRLVALKMLAAGTDTDPERVLRFRNEAEAAARLHHPNIVPIYETGEVDGRPYFCSEYVDGGTLAQHLAGSPQPATVAAAIVEALSQAIDYAHANGILHRDLKPANVLLAGARSRVSGVGNGAAGSSPTPVAPLPIPKITDFGLAKHVDDTSGLTQTGQVLGTPSYMAPEQAIGNSSEVGPRTDVYALGAILYESLTGRPPFKGATPLETLDQVRVSEPVPPSRLVPKLPHDVETICLKAMAKEPGRRYQTAGQLGDDLRRFLKGEPIQARPVGRVEKAWRWCRRNPAIAALSAAVVTALVVATIVSVLFAVHSERARRQLALEQAQTARERDDKDEALRVQRQALDLAVAALRDLTGDIVEEQIARGSELTDENKAFLRKIIQRFDDLAAITADDAESRIIRAEGHASVGLMRYRLGEMKDAEKAYNDAVTLCKQLVEEFPTSVDYRRKLAQSQYNFGMLLRDTGRLKDAEPAYTEALAIRKQLVAEFPTNTEFRVNIAQSQNNLGVLFSIKSRHKEAESAFTDALAAYKQLAADSPERPVYRRELAGTHGNLGNLFGVTDRPKEAESAYKAAHAIRKQLAAEFPNSTTYRKDLASSHNSLGVLFRTTDRYKEAESAFAAALEILQQLADDFPTRPEFRRELARSYNSLGALLYTTDRVKDAEAAYGDAVEIQRKLASDFPNQPDLRNNLAGTIGNLAVLCNKRRDFTAAKAHVDEAQPHHAAALKANPRHPHYRLYYRNNLSALAIANAGLLDHAAAVRTAETIRDLGWDPPANAYDAAIALAKCIPVIEKSEGLNPDVRRDAMQFYGEQTMAMLRDAVAKGFKDATRLAKEDHLNPLRQRDDFAQLLAGLAVKKKE